MNEVGINIAVAEAKSRVEKCQAGGGTLQEQFRTACLCVKGHWMATDPDDQFRAAAAALYSVQSDEQVKADVLQECRVVGQLSAMLGAAQVGLSVSPEGLSELPEHPVGMIGIWREVYQ